MNLFLLALSQKLVSFGLSDEQKTNPGGSNNEYVTEIIFQPNSFCPEWPKTSAPSIFGTEPRNPQILPEHSSIS